MMINTSDLIEYWKQLLVSNSYVTKFTPLPTGCLSAHYYMHEKWESFVYIHEYHDHIRLYIFNITSQKRAYLKVNKEYFKIKMECKLEDEKVINFFSELSEKTIKHLNLLK